MRDTTIVDGIEYDNFSVDNEVGFIEEGHIYTMLKKPDFKFTSVTTVIDPYEDGFDAPVMAVKCSKNKQKPEYYGRDPKDIEFEWSEKGRIASEMGTRLHNLGEDYLNGVDNPEDIPDSPKTKFIKPAVDTMLSNGYELALTELLVYDEGLAICGQSDILLKKKYDGEYLYQIYDWKFLSEPIKKKSFYNRFTRKFSMLKGPFKHLMHCNWIHYSIQLSIYQTLCGDPGMVTEKVLVVITDDGTEFVPCYPMRVYWDTDGNLQAVYQNYKGLWYISETDSFQKDKPTWIEGL